MVAKNIQDSCSRKIDTTAMNKAEVKDKLRSIVRELLFLDLKADQEIPETISNYFLGNYSLTNNQKLHSEDLTNFILRLHKYIEDKHLMNDSSTKPEICNVKIDYREFVEAELEYSEITMELIKMLGEVMQMKDKYSEYFKDKCKAQETSIDVMYRKCEFLKSQLFLKLYGEENALSGHLVLRDMLREELNSLQKQYNELVELNRQYDNVKNDEAFLELFRKYRELRKIEGITEIWNEIL